MTASTSRARVAASCTVRDTTASRAVLTAPRIDRPAERPAAAVDGDDIPVAVGFDRPAKVALVDLPAKATELLDGSARSPHPHS